MSQETIWIHIPKESDRPPYVVREIDIISNYLQHQTRTVLVSMRVWEDYLATMDKLRSIREEMIQNYPPPQLRAFSDPERIAARLK